MKKCSKIAVMKYGLLLLLACISPAVAHAQDSTFMRGTIVDIQLQGDEVVGALVAMPNEAGQPTERTLEADEIGQAGTFLKVGDVVVMERLVSVQGEEIFILREPYRLPGLVWLGVAFIALGVVLGGKRGFYALLGLLLNVAILIFFVIPRMAAGDSPLVISLVGVAVMATVSIALAHGWNKRTLLSIVSTILTLILTIAIAMISVYVVQLFGTGSEESVFLMVGSTPIVNFRGLLLAGMVIGALGILDDITTAQTATIDELSKANPATGIRQLWNAGISVGREHIASLMNSLALAYAGASLPLLLLFWMNSETPLWVLMNNEFIAQEIVRTLVGSIGLLFAVPISTALAAWQCAHGKHSSATSRACAH